MKKTSAVKNSTEVEEPGAINYDLEIHETPKAPDGGYGWVIVFASFMANTVVDGIAYSFGILLPELTTHYKGSVQTAAWVGSLLTGVYMLVGPVAGGLVNRFGARFVCIGGAVIGVVSFVASIWAPSLSALMFTYGFLGGIGFGFIYLPACVYVSYYFDKKRALATGIAVSGSGFGTFVFAPLTVALIETYCWQGALWIMAGIIANCAVFGALLWPLRPSKSCTLIKKGSAALEPTVLEEFMEGPDEKVLLVQPSIHSSHPLDLEKSNNVPTEGFLIPRNLFQRSAGSLLVLNQKLKPNCRSISHQAINYHQPGSKLRSSSVHSLLRPGNVDRPFSKQDIFYPGSVHKIPELHSSATTLVNEKTALDIPSPVDEADEFIDQMVLDNRVKRKKFTRFIPRSVTAVVLSMVDFKLLKHPVMMILCISNIVGMLGFYVPFVFMTNYSEALGNSKESSSLLLSVIGITNTIGRVLFGWVSDQHWVAALTINNVVLLICGVLTCLCIVFTSYGLLMTYCVLFGLFIAPYVSLSAVILVEEIGLQHLTNAFGLLTLARGISAMIGTPVGGAIFDMTGSYGMSFFVAGVLIFVSGLISYLIPLLRYWENRKKKRGLQNS